MAAKEKKPVASEEVESLFTEIETFTRAHFLEMADSYPMKIQIEKDFRGRPVISVRVRKENVENEIMETLRYPE